MIPIDDSHSWWTSADSQGQQSSVSRNLTFGRLMEYYCTKQLGFNFQEQGSSSTQSTGQSCPEVANVETEKYGKPFMSIQSASCGVQVKPGDDHSKSTISFQDYGLPCSSIDYRQYASFPFTFSDPYHPGLLAAYGQYPAVYSQMMGMTPTRVPLPIDAPQDEPMYVNAKQFRAILRRRKARAKLEAQNKLSKIRKPYLHVSRHHHALNRARGPGGRFLNQTQILESKAIAKTNDQDISCSTQLQLNTERMESGVLQKEDHKEGISMCTCSDITSLSNMNNVAHHQDFRFSVYQSHGGSPPSDGGSRTDGVQQFLSVHQ